MYGSNYQVYGAGPCPRTNRPHALASQIRETQRSRFVLMQLIAEMSTAMSGAGGGIARPVMHAGAGQKFMLGVLLTGGATYVAASGSNNGNNALVTACMRKGYTLCPPRSATGGVHHAVSGRVIPAGQYMSMQAPGASRAGDCAAPRLIEQAIATPAALANRANWAMSEVFYQPNTARRAQDDLYWVHGLSAHSCATCENLVPLLLCPDA